MNEIPADLQKMIHHGVSRSTPMSIAFRMEEGHVHMYTAAALYDKTALRGAKAGGKCVMCGSPVALRLFTKPRKGQRVTSDFQHLKRYPCRDSVSCDVHDRALMVVRAAILKGLVVNLPDGSVFIPKDVVADKAIGEIRPDIILIDAAGCMLLIEIYVTHPVTAAKEMFLRSLGHPAFEVDMSKTYRREVSNDDIEASIFGSAFRKRWIVKPGDGKVPLEIRTTVPSSDPGYQKVMEEALAFDAEMKARFGFGLKSIDIIQHAGPISLSDDRQIKMQGIDAGARSPRGGMQNPRAYAIKRSGKSNGGVVANQGPGIFDVNGLILRRASKPVSEEYIEARRRMSA